MRCPASTSTNHSNRPLLLYVFAIVHDNSNTNHNRAHKDCQTKLSYCFVRFIDIMIGIVEEVRARSLSAKTSQIEEYMLLPRQRNNLWTWSWFVHGWWHWGNQKLYSNLGHTYINKWGQFAAWFLIDESIYWLCWTGYYLWPSQLSSCLNPTNDVFAYKKLLIFNFEQPIKAL